MEVVTEAGPSNSKKRVHDDDEESQSDADLKRPRLSSVSSKLPLTVDIQCLRRGTPSPERSLRRQLRRERTESDISSICTTPSPMKSARGRPNPGMLSRQSSFTFGSTLSSPASSTVGFIHSGVDFTKRTLSLSFTEAYDGPSAEPQRFPEQSAKYYLRNTRVTIDFSLPTSSPSPVAQPSAPDASTSTYTHTFSPLCLSPHNLLFFTRGDRVHYKNITSESTTVAQLCRMKDTLGHVQAIVSHCSSSLVALGTSKGCVQIYDVSNRTLAQTFTTKEVTSMSFHGPSNPNLITVGSHKGAIRYFDLRDKPANCQKSVRHHSAVTKVAVNYEDARLVASGDMNGNVYCWDMRNLKTPLDVGEFVQRRKKMVHDGSITALSWCPWLPKLLASGSSSADGKGTLKTWNINGSVPPNNPSPSPSYSVLPRPAPAPKSDLTNPGIVQFDTQITSLHFSPQCKEILCTHGSGPPRPPPPQVQIQSQSPPLSGAITSPFGTSSSHLDDLDEFPIHSPPKPNLPSATANAISVHSAHALRLVMTERVADWASEGGIGSSVINRSGTRLVLSIPAEGRLKMYECWGKIRESKGATTVAGLNIR